MSLFGRVTYNLRGIVRVWKLARANQEKLPKRPRALGYRLPRRWIVGMGQAMLFKRPRSIVADSALAVRSLPRLPVVEGVEHIPASGSFVLASNHCQRKDLWIAWSMSLLIDCMAGKQPDLVVHMITTDRAVFDGFTFPTSRWAFERVAIAWDVILMTPPEAGEDGPRRNALRHCLEALKRVDGRPVCLGIAPEGLAGTARGLGETMPGSGRSLLALAGRGLPILPAVVWEEAPGKLHARFGPVWHPAPPAVLVNEKEALDEWAREATMCRLATLLPAELRGRYAPADKAAGALPQEQVDKNKFSRYDGSWRRPE